VNEKTAVGKLRANQKVGGGKKQGETGASLVEISILNTAGGAFSGPGVGNWCHLVGVTQGESLVRKSNTA